MCNFGEGFQAPEMVKNRPVVVLSPKLKRCSGLCTVVPISTVLPDPMEKWHYKLPQASLPNAKLFIGKQSWVKGDMIYRVSFHRLDRIRIGKDGNGKRLYFDQRLGKEQMKNIYACVLNSLNLEHLPEYL